MTPDVSAALARVPRPVEVGTRLIQSICRGCGAMWGVFPVLKDAEHHTPDCWWPAFVAAREALAAGVTVEGVVERVGSHGVALMGPLSGPGLTGVLARFYTDEVVALDGRRVTVTIRPVGEAARP
jgi:hypothetical protein